MAEAYLWAHEIYKYHLDCARQQLPDPDLRPNLINRNPSRKYGNEATAPLTKGYGCAADVAVCQGRNLFRMLTAIYQPFGIRNLWSLPLRHRAMEHRRNHSQRKSCT